MQIYFIKLMHMIDLVVVLFLFSIKNDINCYQKGYYRCIKWVQL